MTEGKTFAFENSRDLLRTEVLVQTLFNIGVASENGK